MRTYSEKYLSVPPSDKETILAKKAELRADADDIGEFEGLRVKCQREHVLKARIEAVTGKAGGEGRTRLLDRGGPSLGSVEDELARKYVQLQDVVSRELTAVARPKPGVRVCITSQKTTGRILSVLAGKAVSRRRCSTGARR